MRRESGTDPAFVARQRTRLVTQARSPDTQRHAVGLAAAAFIMKFANDVAARESTSTRVRSCAVDLVRAGSDAATASLNLSGYSTTRQFVPQPETPHRTVFQDPEFRRMRLRGSAHEPSPALPTFHRHRTDTNDDDHQEAIDAP